MASQTKKLVGKLIWYVLIKIVEFFELNFKLLASLTEISSVNDIYIFVCNWLLYG